MLMTSFAVLLMLTSMLAVPGQVTSSPAPISSGEKGKFGWPPRPPMAHEIAPELFEKYRPNFKISPNLLEALKNPEVTELEIIIQHELGIDIISRLPPGVRVRYTFENALPFVSAVIPADEELLYAIADTPGVVAIYGNVKVNVSGLLMSDIASLAPSFAAGRRPEHSPWIYLMNETLRDIGAYDVWAEGYTGMGVVVALLDSGINKDFQNFYFPEDFPDPAWRLKNKVIYEYDFTGEGPADYFGHGTMAAHIIGSTGRTGGRIRYYNYDADRWDYAYTTPEGVKGVAPGCFLMNIKIVTSDGSTSLEWMIAGIIHAVTHGADVIYCAIGFDWLSTIMFWEDYYPVFYAIEWAVQNGVTVVWAAGNEGPGYGTIATPGNLESIITVGASDELGLIPVWSARGPTTGRGARGLPFPAPGPNAALRMKPDIVAPGELVISLYYDWRSVDYYFTVFRGTSVSTAFVAGAVALLLDAYPGLRPSSVKIGLMEGAEKLTEPFTGEPYDYHAMGAGRLNVYGAYTYLAEVVPEGKDSEIGPMRLARYAEGPAWEYWAPYFNNVSILVEDRICNYGEFNEYLRELESLGVQIDYASDVLPRKAIGTYEIVDVPDIYFPYRGWITIDLWALGVPTDAEMVALHFPVMATAYYGSYGRMEIYDENMELKHLYMRRRGAYWYDVWTSLLDISDTGTIYIYCYGVYGYTRVDVVAWVKGLKEVDIPDVESSHPYSPGSYWIYVELPVPADAFSLHFTRIDFEDWWDWLEIWDEDRTTRIAAYTGGYYGWSPAYPNGLQDVWSPMIPGRACWLHVWADVWVDWGFHIDMARIYRAAYPGKIYRDVLSIETDHPYEDTWSGGIVAFTLESNHPYNYPHEGHDVSISTASGVRIRFHFESIQLEDGDVLRVINLLYPGEVWEFTGSGADVWTDWFTLNASGYGEFSFCIFDDGDEATDYGFKVDGYETAAGRIWGPVLWYEEDRNQTRLHFAKIELDCGDWIHIYDAEGNEWWWGGNATDVWSDWLYGERVWIELVSFDMDTKGAWGFVIDMYESKYLRTSKDLLKHYEGYYMLEPTYFESELEKTITVETTHPYDPNIDKWWTVSEPGAVRIRLHFERITLAEGDYIEIYDEDMNLVETYVGPVDISD
ncbi:hypothetical protein DRO33_02205, partial [Candidatus Bathyarchaeota archaeon]